jgi:iron complex outermembrane receptor protein
MENQQWGGDHGFAVSQLGISSVEVMKGPSSLLYGADAIGGVIYLVDEPYSRQGKQELSASSRFESHTAGTQNTLSYKASKGMFRLQAAGLYGDFADYRLPNGSFLNNSRYKQYGAKASVGASKGSWVGHLRHTYAQGQNGIIGEVEGEKPGEVLQLTSQERNIVAPFQEFKNHILSFENKLFQKENEWYLLLASTSNQLFEFEDSPSEAALNMYLNNQMYNFRYSRQLNAKFRWVNGVQGMFVKNENDKDAEEQLIPDFNQFDNGIYSLLSFGAKKITAQMGARFDQRILSISKLDYSRPNFSLGLVTNGQVHVL